MRAQRGRLRAGLLEAHRMEQEPPRPQPQTFSKLVFLIYFDQSYNFLDVIWGSSWGRGFRFHWSRGPGASTTTSRAGCRWRATTAKQEANATKPGAH